MLKPHYLLFIIFTLFASVLALGLFMPIQSDEGAWFWLNYRAVLDDFQRIHLFAHCGKESFARPLPISWYLPALFNHVIYAQFDNPFYIRIAGMAHFLLWLGMLALLVRKLYTPTREQAYILAIIVLGFVSQDAMPFMYIFLRPEQPLVLCTTGLIVLLLHREWFATSLSKKLIATFLLFFAVMYMHSVHPKAVAFAPLEMVVVWFVLRQIWGNRYIALTGIAAVIALAAESYLHATQTLDCKNENISNTLALFQTPVGLLFTDPGKFFTEILLNFLVAMNTTFRLDAFFENEGLNWIPRTMQDSPAWHVAAAQTLAGSAFFVKFCLLIYCYASAVKGMWKLTRKTTWQHIERALLILVSFSLLAALTAMMTMLGRMQMFYSTALAESLLLLVTLISVKIFRQERMLLKRWVWIAVVAVTIANLSLLLYRYAPMVESPVFVRQVDPTRGEVMITPMRFTSQDTEDLLSIAEECGIRNDSSLSYVVLDNYSYMAFRQTTQPLNAFYVFCRYCGINHERIPEELFPALREYNSSGLIAACADIPESLKPYVKQRGNACCIPKEVWEEIP